MVDGAGGRRDCRRHLRRDRDDLRYLCGADLLAGCGVPVYRRPSGGPLRQLAYRVGAGLEGTSRRGRVHPAPAEGDQLSHRALGTPRIRTVQRKGETQMATLSVLKFNDPYGADRVLIALQGLQEREMITLQDAAVVSWPQGNKKPTTRQLHSTAGAGAGWGAFWGFLFGLIFFVPFLGAAIGASMGGLSGSLADVGIDDDFIKQVREKVTEGTSALFALTSGATAVDKVVDELKQYDFEIISTNLPEEQEQKLREAFSQEG